MSRYVHPACGAGDPENTGKAYRRNNCGGPVRCRAIIRRTLLRKMPKRRMRNTIGCLQRKSLKICGKQGHCFPTIFISCSPITQTDICHQEEKTHKDILFFSLLILLVCFSCIAFFQCRDVRTVQKNKTARRRMQDDL